MCERCRQYVRDAARARSARKARKPQAAPELIANGGGYYDPNSGTVAEFQERKMLAECARAKAGGGYLPTPAEIESRAAAIRANWVDENGVAIPGMLRDEFAPPVEDDDEW